MRLVPKKKSRRKYDKIIIHIYDGSVYEYDLGMWVVYRDQDWIEMTKVDGTEMNCYTVGNVVMVKFTKAIENKNMSIIKQPMKPVPPAAA